MGQLVSRVTGWAVEILGAGSTVTDRSWPHGASLVLEVVDVAGARWFVKRHGDWARYLAEVAAYRGWVPALGDRAPRLRASDDGLQAVVLSAVPGLPVGEARPARDRAVGAQGDCCVHWQAGVLLRKLHEAEPAAAWPEMGAVKLAEYDRLAASAVGLLAEGDLDFIRAQVRSLGGLSAPLRVPCHLDYGPRNWLVDADGTVRVIDFEWARRDLWVSDLARLYASEWSSRPDLRDAFLDGYGRQLAQQDCAALHAVSALRALWLVVRARATGQAEFEQANRHLLERLRTAQT